jgi:glycosyltransferase involved in cell wall biosynthesis
MRILWFSLSSSLYPPDTNKRVLGGWVEALEQLIKDRNDIALGIAFFHDTDSIKLVQGNRTYYPIYKNKGRFYKRIYNRWFYRINHYELVSKSLRILEDFKPDIITVFGTESSYGLIIPYTKIPTVIHLQGVLDPYINAYYPPGINRLNLLFNDSLLNLIRGINYLHFFYIYKCHAKLEKIVFSNGKYFMGRTDWDYAITKLFAPNAHYFHCEEVLRPAFYCSKRWVPKIRKKCVIVSTISPALYKGLDVIYKTTKVLDKFTEFDYEWQIYGISSKSNITKLLTKSLSIPKKSNKIVFYGQVKESTLIEQLLNADIFVHPSYIDNSPNSVCEAQILGLPVIATNVGGLRSLIKDGIDGVLLPANDPYILAYRLMEIKQNIPYAQVLGKNACQIAELRHDRATIIKKILSIYYEIIELAKT